MVSRGLAENVPDSVMMQATIPFVLADIIRLLLVLAIPALALWLPAQMFQ